MFSSHYSGEAARVNQFTKKLKKLKYFHSSEHANEVNLRHLPFPLSAWPACNGFFALPLYLFTLSHRCAFSSSVNALEEKASRHTHQLLRQGKGKE